MSKNKKKAPPPAAERVRNGAGLGEGLLTVHGPADRERSWRVGQGQHLTVRVQRREGAPPLATTTLSGSGWTQWHQWDLPDFVAAAKAAIDSADAGALAEVCDTASGGAMAWHHLQLMCGPPGLAKRSWAKRKGLA